MDRDIYYENHERYKEYELDLIRSWQEDDYRSILESRLLLTLTKLNWLKRLLNSKHLNPNARTVSKDQTDLDYIGLELGKLLSDIRTIETELKSIHNGHNAKRINKMKDLIKKLLTKKQNLEGYSVSQYEYWINHF